MYIFVPIPFCLLAYGDVLFFLAGFGQIRPTRQAMRPCRWYDFMCNYTWLLRMPPMKKILRLYPLSTSQCKLADNKAATGVRADNGNLILVCLCLFSTSWELLIGGKSQCVSPEVGLGAQIGYEPKDHRTRSVAVAEVKHPIILICVSVSPERYSNSQAIDSYVTVLHDKQKKGTLN